MSTPIPGRALPFLPGTFRALRHRDFRLLWSGQLISLTGTWMQSVAQGWLVLRLSDSALLLGVVGFCSYLPVLVFALPGGVAADRLRRRNALLFTQAFALVVSATLAILTWLDLVLVWHVALLALGTGTAAAFDIPIRQAFLQDLVGREDLPNAIALNSMAFNSARLVGPAIAGILVALYGEHVCFGINTVSFGGLLLSLLLIRRDGDARRPSPGSWMGGIGEVLRYVRRTPNVRLILVLVVVSGVFGMPYTILMPVFARDILDAGARGLGFLVGASGLGAVAGAMHLARKTSSEGLGRGIAVSMAVFGTSLVVFSVSRSFWLSLASLAIVGGSSISQLASSNTFLQLQAPSGLRGRIVSLYLLSFIGMAPFGALISGFAARWLGAPAAVGAGGIVCLAAAALAGKRLVSPGPPA